MLFAIGTLRSDREQARFCKAQRGRAMHRGKRAPALQ